jgi:hypothetical protein
MAKWEVIMPIVRSRYIARPHLYVLTVWAIFLALLLVGVAAWTGVKPTSLLRPEAATSQPNEHAGGGYVGTVITKPTDQNECIEYKFNNSTGVFSQIRTIGCSEGAVPRLSNSQSAEGLRFRSVKKAFGGAVH